MVHRLAALAELVGGTVEGDPERPIEGLSTLERAGPEHLSFLTNPRYRRQALASKAGALLVGPALAGLGRDLLISEDPYFALAELLDLFHPAPAAPAGIHPTAIVAADAEVDDTASIGPYAVVGSGSRVGARAILEAHVVIGRDCRVGENAHLYPRVVLYDGTEVGARAILHSGVVLGSDGFGFATRDGVHRKLRHAGRVVVEADVEIGANSAVDRALLEETRIGEGTKIDNLVQVGHNVRTGRGCLLVSQTGLSGSVRLGDGVVLAGQAGVAGHLDLGDGSRVAAKSAVFKAVPAGRTVAGIPAVDAARWRRQQALAGKLPELRRRLRALERLARVAGEDDAG